MHRGPAARFQHEDPVAAGFLEEAAARQQQGFGDVAQFQADVQGLAAADARCLAAGKFEIDRKFSVPDFRDRRG